MRAKIGWLVISGIAVSVGAACGWQLREVVGLRAELSREKAAARPLESARGEHERLLAVQPTAKETERLVAEIATLPQARAEVAALRQQVELAERANAEEHSAPVERFAVGSTVAAADWRNAGAATPQAALETVLCAGAGGDVDTFAKALLFVDGRTRRAAQALWETLSEPMRAQYGTPERLIAFLAVRDVPLGSAKVRQSTQLDGWPAPAALMELALRDVDGRPKEAELIFMNPGDGWKLVVMETVVAKYAAMLKAQKALPEGK